MDIICVRMNDHNNCFVNILFLFLLYFHIVLERRISKIREHSKLEPYWEKYLPMVRSYPHHNLIDVLSFSLRSRKKDFKHNREHSKLEPSLENYLPLSLSKNNHHHLTLQITMVVASSSLSATETSSYKALAKHTARQPMSQDSTCDFPL